MFSACLMGIHATPIEQALMVNKLFRCTGTHRDRCLTAGARQNQADDIYSTNGRHANSRKATAEGVSKTTAVATS